MRPESDLLRRILEQKQSEVEALAAATTRAELEHRCREAAEPRGFGEALRQAQKDRRPGVIAEMKRSSPSQGLLRRDYDPAVLAMRYLRAGADCLSVLTDRSYFMGRPEHLQAAAVSRLPLLRKDFLIDALQILESRALGADCILLIAAALAPRKLRELAELACALGMDVLLEVHDERELEQALQLPREILIGINNRNLNTFHTDLEVSRRLLLRVDDERLTVSESGIHDPEQVTELSAAGAKAFLVGEAFMRAADPGARLRELFYPERRETRPPPPGA